MGGTDAEENLTPPISVKEHADLHRELWLRHGNKYDLIAWKALSGRITSESARLAAAKVGQSRSQKFKESRKILGLIIRNASTKESCSKGGKVASVALLEWQKQNAEKFKAACAATGRASGERQKIPHLYEGVVYESKQLLQKATGLSNCGFYGKLRRSEILRLDKKSTAGGC
jgi:hypothetical protein